MQFNLTLSAGRLIYDKCLPESCVAFNTRMLPSLEGALNSLSPKQREYMYDTYVEQLSIGEVAELHRVKEDTVRKSLQASISILRRDKRVSECPERLPYIILGRRNDFLSSIVKPSKISTLTSKGIKRVRDLEEVGYEWLRKQVDEDTYVALVTSMHTSGYVLKEDDLLPDPENGAEGLFYDLTCGVFKGGYPARLTPNIWKAVDELPALVRGAILCSYQTATSEIYNSELVERGINILSKAQNMFYICHGHKFSVLDMRQETLIDMLDLPNYIHDKIVEIVGVVRLKDLVKVSEQELHKALEFEDGELVIRRLEKLGFRRYEFL